MKTKLSDGKSVIFRNDFLDYQSGRLLSPIETQNYYLLQTADSYYLTDFSGSEHTQYCDLELTIVLYGSLLSFANGVFEKVEKGEVYLSFRDEKHIVKSNNGTRFQTLAINFKDTNQNILKLLKEKYQNTSSHKTKLNISAQMTTILSEFIAEDLPFKNIQLDALISEILINLARGERVSKNKFYDKKDLLPDLIHYIDKNFLSIYSLNELTEEFGYSYGYLCKLFKNLYGRNLSNYLNEKRMSYAKTALIGGASVNDVAETLHYNSPFNFTRAFKKEYGKPPSTFIK